MFSARPTEMNDGCDEVLECLNREDMQLCKQPWHRHPAGFERQRREWALMIQLAMYTIPSCILVGRIRHHSVGKVSDPLTSQQTSHTNQLTPAYSVGRR